MQPTATKSPIPLDPARYRQDFPILAERVHGDHPLVYLDNGASTQRPRAVLDAMNDVYQRHYANVHRGIHWLSEQSTELYEQARETVQRFIGAAAPEEIVFTSGTTAGVNLVARSWGEANLQPGDEILLTEMEHHSNIVPWQQLAAKTGAQVRWLPITDDGRLDLAQLDEHLTERTKLFAVAHISNVLGTINPIEQLADAAHAVGAKLLVDAAQSIPHLATDVSRLGADFIVFSGHKMLGPTGVGVLWAPMELLEAMPAFLSGGSMIRTVTTEGWTPAPVPTKFEAGTPPIVEAIGLAAAVEYLEAVGLESIHEHELRLVRHTFERLQAIEGLRILGPDVEHRSGIVSFSIDDVHAHDLAQLLDRQGVAVRAGHHCTMPLHKRLGLAASTRASFYLYNTEAEVDALAEALASAQRLLAPKRA